MLGSVILNNTERLLAQSPYFAAPAKWWVMHREAIAGSKYACPAEHTAGTGNANIYNEVLDFFLVTLKDGITYRFIPENWFAGNIAMISDTSLGVWQFIIDPQGRTWAVVNNSSGVDGLYLRAASVGTPAWTRVVAASNGSDLTLHRKVNGDIWYHDNTAGNWYLLQNGSVAATQTGAPTGLQTWVPYYEGRWNIDFVLPHGDTIQNHMASGGPDYAQASTANIDSTPWQSLASFFDNSAAQSLATFRGRVPSDLFLAPPVSYTTVVGAQGVKTIRLNSTYSLLVSKNVGGYLNTGPSLSFALLNKVTWTIKYLGTTFMPPVFGTTSGANYVEVRSARIKNGGIDLFMNGYFLSTSYAGLAYATIPLSKIDF